MRFQNDDGTPIYYATYTAYDGKLIIEVLHGNNPDDPSYLVAFDGATGEITSCLFYLPMPGHGSTTADFFNPQIRYIEKMVVENRAPYPLERTLLTSGMTLAGVESFHRKAAVDTPEMAVSYAAPKESLFWRE